MYRNFVLAVVLLFLIISCKEKILNNDNQQGIKSLGNSRLSPLVDSLFRAYTKEVKSTFGYAIYIDKKTEGIEYMITIAPFIKKVNNLYEGGAVNYFIFNDSIPVFLYTGLEDFVACDSPSFSKAKETIPKATQGKEFKDLTSNKLKIDFSQSWSYIHVDDTSYIVKGNSAPFLNITLRPTIYFHIPDSLVKR